MSDQRVPAIYTRVSTDMQASKEVGSLEVQELTMRRYMELKHGDAPPPIVFREEGESGKDVHRPALQTLMAAVRAGRISMILVTRLDRLTRSLLDFMALHKELKHHEVKLVSNHENFDTTSPMGSAMLKLLLVFAELEREQTAERTKEAIRARKAAGLWTGGAPPLGYDNKPGGVLEVNEDEARIVRTVFEQYLKMRSAPKVAKWLNEQGFRQKRYASRRKGPKGERTFAPSTVRALVRNQLYIGRIKNGDDHVAGAHDGIVDEELFRAANTAMDGNRKKAKAGKRQPGRAEHDYLLLGLAKNVHGYAFTSSSTKKRSTEGVRYYPYYRNVGSEKYPDAKFDIKTVAAGKLERAVVGSVRRLATRPAIVAAAVEKANELAAEQQSPLLDRVEALRKEAKLASEQAERIVIRALSLDVGDSRLVREQITKAERRQAQTTSALASAEAELAAKRSTVLDLDVVTRALEDFDAAWDALESAERRDLLSLLIERVVVRPGQAEVHFHGSDAVTVWLDRRGQQNEETPPGSPEGFAFGSKWLRQLDERGNMDHQHSLPPACPQ